MKSPIFMSAVASGLFIVTSGSPAGYAPIIPPVCQTTSQKNIGPQLPRPTLGGKSASSDLGSYNFFKCEGTGIDTTCSLDTDYFNSIMKDGGSIQKAAMSPDSTHLEAYVMGTFSYTLLNIVLVVLIPLFTALLLFCRYCTCCCCKPESCTCIRCGTAWPTPRGKCGCGFSEYTNTSSSTARTTTSTGKKASTTAANEDDDEDGPTKEFKYSTCSRIASYLYMICFLVFGSAMILLAHVQGSVALTDGLFALVAGTTNSAGGHNGGAGMAVGTSVQLLAQGMVPPAVDFVIDIGSLSLAPLLSGLNDTLHQAIDFDATITAIGCVSATLGNLPDVGVAVTFLTDVNASLVDVKAGVAGIRTDLTLLEAGKNQIQGNVTSLSTLLTSLDTSIASVSTALTSTQAVATTLRNTQVTLSDPTSGTLHAVDTELNALTSTGFPSQSDLESAAGEANAADTSTNFPNLNGILAGSGSTLNGDSASLTSLVSKLTSIRATLTALPDFSQTATNLESLPTAVYQLRIDPGTLGQLSSAIQSLTPALSSLPSSSSFLQAIFGILNATDSITVEPIAAHLQLIAGAITSLPDFAILLHELDKLDTIQQIIPCLYSLVAQLTTVNTTLALLPDSVSGITDIVDTANSTLQSALDMVTTIRSSILDANTSIHGVDTTSYVSQIQDVNTTLRTKRGSFDVSALTTSLRDVDSQAQLNFTSILEKLSSVNDTLGNFTIPANIPTALRSFQTFLVSCTSQLTTLISQYTLLAKGYCSDTGSDCTSTSDCSGGSATCLSNGIFRCYDTTASPSYPAPALQATSCTQDSQCTGGSSSGYCLADSTRAGTVKTILRAATSNKPDVSEARANIAAAQSSFQSVDILTSLSDISNAITTLNGINTATYRTQINDVSNGFNAFNFNDVQSSIDSATSSIDGVDFSSYLDSLTSVKDSTEQVKDYQTMVDEGLTTLRNVRTFLHVDLGMILTNLSKPVLTAAKYDSVTGVFTPSNVILKIASVADSLVTMLKDRLGPNSTYASSLPSFNAHDLVQKSIASLIDKAAGGGNYTSIASHGPLHYFLSLAKEDMIIPADGSVLNPKYVYANAAGQSYSKSKMCLTRECLGDTVIQVNRGKLADISQVFPGTFPSSFPAVPLTRETLFLIPWIFPILALFCGAWSLFTSCLCNCCCCCKRDGGWQKIPPSCMVGAIICQIPCILLVTAFLFPMSLLFTDFCASGQNIGYNYVVSSGDGLCAIGGGYVISGGVAGVANCEWTFDLPSVFDDTVSVRMDIASLTRSVFGTCPSTLAQDPFSPAFTSVTTLARTLPAARTQQLLATTVADIITLRSQPKLVILSAVNAAGEAVATLLEGIHANSVNCDRLNSAISEMKEGMCCGMISPVFWYVSAWYMMALAMIVCGIPAGCLGRKRMPSKLWGLAYKNALAALEEEEEEEEDEKGGKDGKEGKRKKKMKSAKANRSGGAAVSSSSAEDEDPKAANATAAVGDGKGGARKANRQPKLLVDFSSSSTTAAGTGAVLGVAPMTNDNPPAVLGRRASRGGATASQAQKALFGNSGNVNNNNNASPGMMASGGSINANSVNLQFSGVNPGFTRVGGGNMIINGPTPTAPPAGMYDATHHIDQSFGNTSPTRFSNSNGGGGGGVGVGGGRAVIISTPPRNDAAARMSYMPTGNSDARGGGFFSAPYAVYTPGAQQQPQVRR